MSEGWDVLMVPVLRGQGAMPLFKSSPKSPQDLVKSLRDALQVLNTTDGGGKKSDKVSYPTSCVCVQVD